MMATIKKRKRILLPESSSESELDDVESPKKDLPPAVKNSAKGGPDAKRLKQEEKDSGSEEDGDDSMGTKEDFSDDDEVDTDTDCRKTSSKNEPHSPSYGITPRRSASRKNIRYNNGESSSDDSDSDIALAALRKDTAIFSDNARDQLKNASPCDYTASPSEDDVEEISDIEEKHPSSSRHKKASRGHEDCDEEEEEISGFEEQGSTSSPDQETVSSSDDEEAVMKTGNEKQNTSPHGKRTPSSDDDDDEEDEEEEEADNEKKVVKCSSRNPPRTGRLAVKSKRGKTISSDDDSEYYCDDDDDDKIDGDSPKHQRMTEQSKNKLKTPKRQSTHKSPKKSQKISPQAVAKVLADSCSDENVDSAKSSSSDSDEPLSRTKKRLSSSKVHSKASSEPVIESDDKCLKRDKPIKKGQKLDQLREKQKTPTSQKLKPHLTKKGKPKLSKMASEVLDSEEEDEEQLSKHSKRGAALRNSESDSVPGSDSDHTKSSFTKGPVSKAKTKSPKLKSSKRKSSKERSGTINAPHHKSKSPSVKPPETNKSRQKSHNLVNYSESDSDNEVFESKIKIESRKHGHTSSSKHKNIKQRRHHKDFASDKKVSSESDSDNEALSAKKVLAKQKSSHKGGRERKSPDKKKKTDNIIVSSEDESDAVEIKVQCKFGSKKSQKNRKESPEESDSDLNDEKDSCSDDSDHPHADRTGSAQVKARKHQETAKKRSQRSSFPENHHQNSKESQGKVIKERPYNRDESDDEDSSSVSSSLTISSLSLAEEEEEKQQKKTNKRKTEKQRASGSNEDASKKKSSSKSNGSARKSSVDGGGDAKSSSQKDSKRLELFKRFVRLSGLRVTYVKLFADVEDEKKKIKLLHKVLQDAGLKGKPTLAKCKQLREKRDELAELAALNMDNIIKGNSDTGRSRRRNVCSRYLKQSPGGHQASPSPKRIKPVDHFANLRSIISDDSDSN